MVDVIPKLGTIVPTMGIKTSGDNISTALFGKVRHTILALLLTDPQRSYFLSEVVRLVDAGRGAVQRELANLVAAGIINRSISGRQVYFQANTACPVFAELSGLVLKTAGVAGMLRQALLPWSPAVRLAFIYGSWARGEQGLSSDVDLMVVGDLSLAQVVATLAPCQERLGREINPSVYPPQEFNRKLSAGHHFLDAVAKGPKIFLIGGESELARLAGARLAD